MFRLGHLINHLLDNPKRVFVLGLVVTSLILLFDGSLWRFWSLQRGQEELKRRMVDLEAQAQALEFKIHQADQLTYVERQATDQFDYVREGDLIFVFSD